MPRSKEWFRVGRIAREEEEETGEQAELAHFAPEIYTDERKEAVLPSLDFDDDALTVEAATEHSRINLLPQEEKAPVPAEEPKEEPEPAEEERENAEPEREAEQEEPAKEQEAEPEDDPSRLFDELRALPLASRVYGLYGSRLLLSCPNGADKVLLFEENGACIPADAGDCAAYIRIAGVEGVFRGKRKSTTDLEYLMTEKSFPLSFLATNSEQYELAEKEGFLPYKKAPNSRGVLMIKPLSLYRIKDLTLRVEFADGRSIRESSEYLIGFDRSLFEDTEGSRQFQRIGRAAAELLLAHEHISFTVQIMKIQKNLVLCFPMDGTPEKGDLLAGERIVELAPAKNGALVLQLGTDDEVKLKLREGTSEKGQRHLSLSEK